MTAPVSSSNAAAVTATSKRKPSSRGGSVTMGEHGLLVRFSYNKQRFASIKSLGTARYDRVSKVWRVPFESLEELQMLSGFEPHRIKYDIDPDVFLSLQNAQEVRRNEALERLQANPFSVSASDLGVVKPTLTFFWDDSLHVSLARGTRSTKLLKAFPCLLKRKHTRDYWCPVEVMPQVLRWARDNEVSFGVESTTAELLTRSAVARKRVLAARDQNLAEESPQQLSYNPEELLLFPYLKEQGGAGDERYQLIWQVPEQLEVLLPFLGHHNSRAAYCRRLSLDDALQLLFFARAKGLPLWGSEAAVAAGLRSYGQKIKERPPLSEPYNEGLLWLAEEPLWFGVAGEQEPLLVVRTDSENKALPSTLTEWIAQAAADGCLIERAGGAGARWYRVPMRSFGVVHAEVCQHSDLGEVPVSSGAQKLLVEAMHRQELLQKREAYHLKEDMTVDMGDAALEDTLFPHQRIAVSWLLDYEASMVADDMGLGKTLSVLASFAELKRQGTLNFLLVICPLSLVKNWVREAEQWTPDLSVQALPTGTKAQRVKALAALTSSQGERPDVLVLNYEAARLEYVTPALVELLRSSEALLCLDESQRVKNAQSVTFTALRQCSLQAKRRVLLSGTPTPKDISDIWSQMYLIDHGQRFGSDFNKWLPTIAETGNKWSKKAVSKFFPDQVEETISRLREVMLRRKKEDVVSLPPKLFTVRDVELKGDQAKRYEQVREDLLVRVTSASGRTFARQVQDVMEEYLRAVQIASNPRLVDEEWEGDPAKFLVLDEIVEQVVEHQKEKLIVWTNYRKNVEELCERYDSLGCKPFYGGISKGERAETVAEFQDEESSTRILIATPAAGGVGITLTAARTVVYLEKTWNAEHYFQSIDRVHRIGQTGTVSILSLVGSPIDTMIARNLEKKGAMLQKVMDDSQWNESLLPTRQELIESLASLSGAPAAVKS